MPLYATIFQDNFEMKIGICSETDQCDLRPCSSSLMSCMQMVMSLGHLCLSRGRFTHASMALERLVVWACACILLNLCSYNGVLCLVGFIERHDGSIKLKADLPQCFQAVLLCSLGHHIHMKDVKILIKLLFSELNSYVMENTFRSASTTVLMWDVPIIRYLYVAHRIFV
jgi:hypothetical protein